MGRYARKAQRAALADKRQGQKKLIRKVMKDTAIKRALKDKAQRLVAKSMRKQEQAKMAEKVREHVEAAKAEPEPSEVVQAMYLVQTPPDDPLNPAVTVVTPAPDEPPGT